MLREDNRSLLILDIQVKMQDQTSLESQLLHKLEKSVKWICLQFAAVKKK